MKKNEELKLLFDTTMEAIILFKDDKVVDCNKVAIEFNYSSKYDLINKILSKLLNKSGFRKIHDRPFETTISKKMKVHLKFLINIKIYLKSQIFKI